jgi:aspartyl-tRNA(Asn)/glutamyl-tRNA(Gln) amidotransferase subunit B
MSEYEPAIGLEVHVQLRTRTKLFCGDLNEFGAPPNTLVCPVCLGLPGALPVTNSHAVTLAVRAAVGLGCTVHELSTFERKNYSYPDLPKGYQITQYRQPLATGGHLDVPRRGALETAGAAAADPDPAVDTVRIRRVHIEEDAGRLVHDRIPGATAVDLNRAGVPLLEIVTEPDLRDAATTRRFLDRLKQTLRYLGVSDCDMEQGSLRVDVNVSIGTVGAATVGPATELKNLNSFAGVERAVASEIERQLQVVRSGGQVERQTLLWDARRGVARSMRAKEDSQDYRYFAEPDLPPLHVSAALVRRAAEGMPELPAARETRFREVYGLPHYDATVLAADAAVADYFEAAAAASGDPRAAGGWVMNDVLGWLNRSNVSIVELPVTAAALAELIRLVAAGTVSRTAARTVFRRMTETGDSASHVVRRHGLQQVSDEARLAVWVDDVVAGFPDEVARCRAGDLKLTGFLMGRIMHRSGGRADPGRAAVLLRARIADYDASGA